MVKFWVWGFFSFKIITASLFILFGLYSKIYIPLIQENAVSFAESNELFGYFLSDNGTHHKDVEEDECPVQKLTNITTPYDYCNFVKNITECRDNEWILLYYCGFYPPFHKSVWAANVLFFALGIFFVFMMFYLIADTTDVYFSPAIIKIVDYLRIPSTVAGVTLLAFGNGSPDLFSILAGLLTQNTSLALSAPIGAGVFVSGVVFGLVIIFAKVEDPEDRKKCFLLQPAFKAATRSFVRDVLFYIAAITVVFTMYLLRFTSVFAGLGLICVYLIYVVFVVLGNYLITRFYVPWKTERDKVRKLHARHKRNSEKRKKRDETTALLSDDTLEEASSDTSSAKNELDEVEAEIGRYLEPEIDDDWTGGWNIRAVAPSKSVKEKQKMYLAKYSRKPKGQFLSPPSPVVHSGETGKTKVATGVSPPVHIQVPRTDSQDEIDEHGQVDEGILSALIQDNYFSVNEQPEIGISGLDVDAVVESVTVVLGQGEGLMGDEESQESEDVKRTLKQAHDVVITKKEPVYKALFERLIAGIGWEEMSWAEKVFYFIFGWYTRILRDLTTPRSEAEHWNKLFASFTPLFGSLFASYTFFKLMGFISKDYLIFLIVWFSATAVIGGVLAFFMFITTSVHRPPIYNFLLVFFAFIASICWVYNAAEMLVKILSVFGKILHMNPSVLGLTVLAWGNSFPDMVANINIARKGYPQMAMGACFGEPLLNSLIGVGVLFTWMSLNNLSTYGYACYPLGTDPSLMISFFTLIFQSVLSLVTLALMRFRIRKFYGFVLIAIYLVQLILALAASFDPNHVGWFFGLFRILTRAQTHRLCPINAVA